MKATLLVLALSCSFNICKAQLWVPLTTGTTNHLRDVHFVTALEGYIVGENATILKTTDGGQTWTTVPNPTPSGVALLGLHVQQGDQGSIVHVCGNQPDAFGNNPTLLRSLDGGATWEQQMLSLATGQGFLIDVHCQSEQDCFLAGTETEEGAMVARNTSGGSVWPHQLLYMDVLGTPTPAANLREFSFPSSEVGYCVGVDDQNLNGIVFKTIDAGTSWTAVHEFTGPSYLMSIRCLSVDECFCSSINGSIYRTVNGGTTWMELQVHDNIVADLGFVDQSIGYASATTTMLKTMDGGLTWNQDPGYTAPIGTVLKKLHVAPAYGFAIVVGNNGVAYKTSFDPISVGVPESSILPLIDARYDPSLEQLTIHGDGMEVIEIFDVLGRSILTFKAADPTHTMIDCSSWNTGVYLVSARQSGEVTTTKFIIQ
jgi:photosystem II stability/assembly factor-like uncharacterized protein